MKKALLTFAVIIASHTFTNAQFLIKPVSFSPTGLSNQGNVAGYEAQAGPYTIWKPDSAITISIGGLAPGQGIGGQARFSDDGNFLCGTSHGNQFAEMSRYDVSTGQWTTLGSLGFMIDSTLSGGFGISGDGNTIVGLSWADTTGGYAYAHGVAWNPAEGIMDLGSLHDSIQRSTRANAVSYDGSIVVGWQDYNGPWKSAVWKKNPAGGYYPNEYLLIDTTGSATDEYNQLGECSCISVDGIWIGGYGDYANNGQPWIWSRPTGVVNLGTLPNAGQGFVSGINTDGTMAVGWFDGQLWGDPQIPFIWTSASGIQNLNDYIHNVLGLSTGPVIVNAAGCLSSNGQYIAGYGIDTMSFFYATYRVNAIPSGVSELSILNEMKIYPNPVTSQLTVRFASDEFHQIKITDLAGKEIRSAEFTGKQITIERETLNAGIYFLQATDHQQHIVNAKVIVQ
ncbi:MAG: T9SS type A sorting domain-containing protein [Bacteroidetes bacterium]|nr:T9SS type A sorting domain-containing protein [Bacteroidota bacterium]